MACGRRAFDTEFFPIRTIDPMDGADALCGSRAVETMYVGEGDAEDVIKWFKGNSRAQWLGFFVAGDQQYNKLLNDVIAHGAVFDVVSGWHIDLFLFGGGQKINIVGA